jgi:hypothetical protein
MKLHELLTEGKKQVDEAPMGGLSGLANKAMAKMGSSKAGGKVDTGNIANQLRKEFDTYLGKTGREATKDAVIGFLQSKGYPTQGAAQIINQTVKGQAAAPAGPLSAAAGNLKTRASQAVSGAINKVTDKLKPKDAATAEPEKVDPTGEPAAQSTPNFKQGNYQAPTYKMGTGFDTTTMKNTSKDIDPKAIGGVPKKTKVKVSASKEVDSSRAIQEAGLPRSVIDKAILKAAQDAAIVSAKAPKATSAVKPTAGANTTAAQDTDGDGVVTAKDKQGFMAGVKKGMGKQSTAKVDVNDLAARIAAIEKKVGLA